MSLQSHDHVERIKHVRRPKKSTAERARRQKEQKKRLVALGISQETADKLQPIEIRTLLKRPLRAKQALKGKGLAERPRTGRRAAAPLPRRTRVRTRAAAPNGAGGPLPFSTQSRRSTVRRSCHSFPRFHRA